MNKDDNSGYPDCIGPSVTFDARENTDARVTASGRQIATIPIDKWVHVEIECELGQKTSRSFALTVDSPGSVPKTRRDIAFAGKRFQELHWLGFVCTSAANTVLYVDNLSIRQREP